MKMNKFIIWGAGKIGMLIAKRLRNDSVKYFIDSNHDKIGRYLYGFEVKPVEELFKEKENIMLVKTVQDCMVETVVESWGGRSISARELLNLPEITSLMDEDLYTKFLYDKSCSSYLIEEEPENWYRLDCNDELVNKRLIAAMKARNQEEVERILRSVYLDGEKVFDEYYDVRPGMRLARYIIHSMNKNMKITDFACGHGELILRLAQDGYKTWAADSSETRVTYLQEQGIEASVQNIECTNYESDFFDVVICMECLEHVGNVVDAVAEISRVLVKDGIVIITVPYMKNCDSSMHVRQFDEVKLASLFRKNFEIINMIKMPYLNWTDDDNLFLVAKKKG